MAISADLGMKCIVVFGSLARGEPGLTSDVDLCVGCPVLFRQRRPGPHGRPFMIYKFRATADARDAQGNLLPDGRCLTRLGRFLRSTTSLDERPEALHLP